MVVLSQRCTSTLITIGTYSYDAEIVLKESGKKIYLHENYFDEVHLSVGDVSIYDFLTSHSEEVPLADFSEEYLSLAAAKKSNYFLFFRQMDNMIKSLIKDKNRGAALLN
jgi:hypothetical protein